MCEKKKNIIPIVIVIILVLYNMNTKPKVIKKQTLQQVICVYCAYCNFYQITNISYDKFILEFKEYWNNLPSTLRLSEKQRNYRINALIGEAGLTVDVLKMMLRFNNQNFVEMWNAPQNRFAEFVLNITNGFIAIKVKKPFTFQHEVCVKNGYLIDSIGGKVFLWKGKFDYYQKWEFVSAIDCDQATEYQQQVTVVEIID